MARRRYPIDHGSQGRKLAKSAGDTSLRALRRQGATVADVRRLIGLS